MHIKKELWIFPFLPFEKKCLKCYELQVRSTTFWRWSPERWILWEKHMILIALCTMPGTPSQGWSLRLYLLSYNSILQCRYCVCCSDVGSCRNCFRLLYLFARCPNVFCGFIEDLIIFIFIFDDDCFKEGFLNCAVLCQILSKYCSRKLAYCEKW